MAGRRIRILLATRCGERSLERAWEGWALLSHAMKANFCMRKSRAVMVGLFFLGIVVSAILLETPDLFGLESNETYLADPDAPFITTSSGSSKKYCLAEGARPIESDGVVLDGPQVSTSPAYLATFYQSENAVSDACLRSASDTCSSLIESPDGVRIVGRTQGSIYFSHYNGGFYKLEEGDQFENQPFYENSTIARLLIEYVPVDPAESIDETRRSLNRLSRFVLSTEQSGEYLVRGLVHKPDRLIGILERRNGNLSIVIDNEIIDSPLPASYLRAPIIFDRGNLLMIAEPGLTVSINLTRPAIDYQARNFAREIPGSKGHGHLSRYIAGSSLTAYQARELEISATSLIEPTLGFAAFSYSGFPVASIVSGSRHLRIGRKTLFCDTNLARHRPPAARAIEIGTIPILSYNTGGEALVIFFDGGPSRFPVDFPTSVLAKRLFEAGSDVYLPNVSGYAGAGPEYLNSLRRAHLNGIDADIRKLTSSCDECKNRSITLIGQSYGALPAIMADDYLTGMGYGDVKLILSAPLLAFDHERGAPDEASKTQSLVTARNLFGLNTQEEIALFLQELRKLISSKALRGSTIIFSENDPKSGIADLPEGVTGVKIVNSRFPHSFVLSDPAVIDEIVRQASR